MAKIEKRKFQIVERSKSNRAERQRFANEVRKKGDMGVIMAFMSGIYATNAATIAASAILWLVIRLLVVWIMHDEE